MKLLAFLLASLFIFQATTPALCMTECLFESVVISAPGDESSCCIIEQNSSCCAAEEVKVSMQSEGTGIAEHTNQDLPCNRCCIPCCSVPLCCCFYEELNEISFSAEVVSLSKQLPSGNGIPLSGYLNECFQPPEFI